MTSCKVRSWGFVRGNRDKFNNKQTNPASRNIIIFTHEEHFSTNERLVNKTNQMQSSSSSASSSSSSSYLQALLNHSSSATQLDKTIIKFELHDATKKNATTIERNDESFIALSEDVLVSDDSTRAAEKRMREHLYDDSKIKKGSDRWLARRNRITKTGECPRMTTRGNSGKSSYCVYCRPHATNTIHKRADLKKEKCAVEKKLICF